MHTFVISVRCRGPSRREEKAVIANISPSIRKFLSAILLQNGGVLLGHENALTWLNANGFGKFEMKKSTTKRDKLKQRWGVFEVTSLPSPLTPYPLT
jgi:hypothetical protein